MFPKGQIHIDFYDEIQAAPEEVLLRLFKFLGVEASTAHISKDLHKKVNSTDGYKIGIPATIACEIALQNVDQLEKLSQRFGGYTTEWLERAEKILAKENRDT
ncbi:MAG: hypothetical protein HN560_06155 [Anaerolineae bacterium]|nr:hypothetical protein [Anaerolineae bacterium]MBT7600640.1 hypothetical protein [Anaerolineae bacterium]MBT7781670.1 hypothetical protein [Anaerolineae bacterium]